MSNPQFFARYLASRTAFIHPPFHFRPHKKLGVFSIVGIQPQKTTSDHKARTENVVEPVTEKHNVDGLIRGKIVRKPIKKCAKYTEGIRRKSVLKIEKV